MKVEDLSYSEKLSLLADWFDGVQAGLSYNPGVWGERTEVQEDLRSIGQTIKRLGFLWRLVRWLGV